MTPRLETEKMRRMRAFIVPLETLAKTPLVEIDARLASEKRTCSRSITFSMGLCLLGAAGVISMISGMSSPLSLDGMLALGVIFCASLCSLAFGDEAIVESLEPLDPSSKHAAEAATLLASSPAAKAWRDDALACGRDLRGFDLAAMRIAAEIERVEAISQQIAPTPRRPQN